MNRADGIHAAADATSLVPVLSPHGRLALMHARDAATLDAAAAERLRAAFARGPGHGLLQLGAGEAATALPAVLAYWRDFAAQYVSALCRQPDGGEHGPRAHVVPPAHDVLASLAEAVRVISILLSPYMPESAQKALDAMSASDLRLEAATFGALGDGARTVTELPPLFPKRATGPKAS